MGAGRVAGPGVGRGAGTARTRGPGRRAARRPFPDLERLPGVPQRADDAGGRRRLDRGAVAANSSRDPYWHAAVRRKTIDHPEHAAAIEDECSICHMPMARTRAGALGLEGRVFANLPRSGGGDTLEAQLAADGVSCTVCHQISDERLGTPESFGGGFVMAAPAADGSRSIAGPFEVNDGHTALMRSATGAQPTEAAHIRQSELCATCHTLTTEAFDADGNVVGSLPEQVPYQEWQHSAFVAEEVGCQSCHMPAVGTRRRSRRAKKNNPGWGSSRIRLALSPPSLAFPRLLVARSGCAGAAGPKRRFDMETHDNRGGSRQKRVRGGGGERAGTDPRAEAVGPGFVQAVAGNPAVESGRDGGVWHGASLGTRRPAAGPPGDAVAASARASVRTAGDEPGRRRDRLRPRRRDRSRALHPAGRRTPSRRRPPLGTPHQQQPAPSATTPSPIGSGPPPSTPLSIDIVLAAHTTHARLQWHTYDHWAETPGAHPTISRHISVYPGISRILFLFAGRVSGATSTTRAPPPRAELSRAPHRR